MPAPSHRYGDLTRGPVPRILRGIAVPASTGLFFNTMYNVVDTWFAGWISTQALAAMSLSMPVFFIILSMAVGMSTGATALIGDALGRGDSRSARTHAIQAITLGNLTALALTALGFWASPFLFRILGAEGAYLATCLAYMNVIFTGAVFLMLNYMLNSVLQAQGDTRSFRNFLILGFVLNVGLDPWFVMGGLFLPPMGIRGIALATVLIQAAGCFYLGYKVHKTGLISDRAPGEILPKLRPLLAVARQGLPASASFLTIGLGVFVIQYFVSRFGQTAVAAYGVAIRIEQIILLPALGLDMATLPLVAQNAGAGLFPRVRETVRTALVYGGVCMGVGALAIFLLARPMLGLFTDSAEVVDIGATYLYIDALVLYAYVVLFVNVAALQGLKKPMFALWIGLFRQVAAPVLVFYLFAQVLGLGLLGIWWGIFAITWCAALVALAYARHMMVRVEEARTAVAAA